MQDALVPNGEPGFEFVCRLGEGSYGSVLLCRERSRDTDETGHGQRLVAVKRFKWAHTDELGLRIATREVRLLKSLDHPLVIQLERAFSSHSGRLYAVFPFIEGGCGQRVLKQCCPTGLPLAFLKLFAWQLCVAVGYLHRQQVLHRDIKPSNVLLSTDGTIRLCDFGFARRATPRSRAYDPRDHVDDSLTPYIQTRPYRAPEVLLGQPYGAPADIWSVGATVAEMATGHTLLPGSSSLDQLWRILGAIPGPHPGPIAAALKTLTGMDPARLGGSVSPEMLRPKKLPGPPLRHRLAHLETSLVDFIEACLRLDPEERPTAEGLLRLPYFDDVRQVLEDNETLVRLYDEATASSVPAAAWLARQDGNEGPTVTGATPASSAAASTPFEPLPDTQGERTAARRVASSRYGSPMHEAPPAATATAAAAAAQPLSPAKSCAIGAPSGLLVQPPSATPRRRNTSPGLASSSAAAAAAVTSAATVANSASAAARRNGAGAVQYSRTSFHRAASYGFVSALGPSHMVAPAPAPGYQGPDSQLYDRSMARATAPPAPPTCSPAVAFLRSVSASDLGYRNCSLLEKDINGGFDVCDGRAAATAVDDESPALQPSVPCDGRLHPSPEQAAAAAMQPQAPIPKPTAFAFQTAFQAVPDQPASAAVAVANSGDSVTPAWTAIYEAAAAARNLGGQHVGALDSACGSELALGGQGQDPGAEWSDQEGDNIGLAEFSDCNSSSRSSGAHVVTQAPGRATVLGYLTVVSSGPRQVVSTLGGPPHPCVVLPADPLLCGGVAADDPGEVAAKAAIIASLAVNLRHQWPQSPLSSVTLLGPRAASLSPPPPPEQPRGCTTVPLSSSVPGPDETAQGNRVRGFCNTVYGNAAAFGSPAGGCTQWPSGEEISCPENSQPRPEQPGAQRYNTTLYDSLQDTSESRLGSSLAECDRAFGTAMLAKPWEIMDRASTDRSEDAQPQSFRQRESLGCGLGAALVRKIRARVAGGGTPAGRSGRPVE